MPSQGSVKGLRLVATDVDWTAGKGPEVTGPAMHSRWLPPAAARPWTISAETAYPPCTIGCAGARGMR